MKIAIIVHSKTGTTRKFADLITNRLRKDGHRVDLVQIETDVPIKTGSVRKCEKFTITNLPDIKGYDVLLFGGPVWGFSASPVIFECMSALGNFEGKKVLPFVTGGLPFKFMGAKQAVGLMSRNAANKNATVLRGAIVLKLFHDFEKEMDQAVNSISASLKGTP